MALKPYSIVALMTMSSSLFACVAESEESDTDAIAQEQRGRDRSDSNRERAVGLMTRNVSLGASLTPALEARDLASFTHAVGAISRQAISTNFPVRAEGLADEIRRADPDLVGLQEVALWRTGAPALAPLMGGPKTATTVRYDVLQLLLDQLNAREMRYRVVAVQELFDFEAPADENDTAGDGRAPLVDAELNVRLTWRNVVLARVGGDVQVSGLANAEYENCLRFDLLGRQVSVPRGYQTLDVRVRDSKPFQFVNTHLEHPEHLAGSTTIGALQANELTARFRQTARSVPVVLVGDLNTGDDTVPAEAQQAYRNLLEGGFVERSTRRPASCCITSSDDLTGGSPTEFDHQVDHVMTNAPSQVSLIQSFVTGRVQHEGYWNSDHAGIFSALRIERRSCDVDSWRR